MRFENRGANLTQAGDFKFKRMNNIPWDIKKIFHSLMDWFIIPILHLKYIFEKICFYNTIIHEFMMEKEVQVSYEK